MEKTADSPSLTGAGYRGRFAPSPTGALHFGSLAAALGSCLDARAHHGQWLLRMENLDRQRERKGAADGILRTLEAFGFAWDGAVLFQSDRDAAYQEALERLRREDLVYPCSCSRKEVQTLGRQGPEGAVYPGVCRAGPRFAKGRYALRVRVPDAEVVAQDRRHGAVRQHLGRDVGDFVLRRVDGLFAYQLAVVVDDAEQGVTDVVRGSDLLLSTPRQVHLQRLLGYPRPRYLHLPLALDQVGRKLSKQDAALPVRSDRPLPALLAALRFLGQSPPPQGLGSIKEFWEWSIAHWDSGRLPLQARAASGEAQ